MSNSILITTSNALEGFKVTQQLGVMRGITVRSRSIIGNFAGGFMTIFGGKSQIYYFYIKSWNSINNERFC